MRALGNALVGSPLLVAGALLAGLAATILPIARRRRYGVLAVGAALLVCTVAAGTGLAAVPALALVWGVAGALAAGNRR